MRFEFQRRFLEYCRAGERRAGRHLFAVNSALVVDHQETIPPAKKETTREGEIYGISYDTQKKNSGRERERGEITSYHIFLCALIFVRKTIPPIYMNGGSIY
jgi:hypothetical protein